MIVKPKIHDVPHATTRPPAASNALMALKGYRDMSATDSLRTSGEQLLKHLKSEH